MTTDVPRAGPPHAARVAATRLLSAAGVDSASYDATALVAHVLGTSPALLPMAPDLSAAQARDLGALIARRQGREPLQHLLGTTGFYGVELAVGPGVFIPRPETEQIVERALRVLDGTTTPRVIDLCAGSGAIAIAIARHHPDARVEAVEKDPAAARWLRRNIAATGVQVGAVEHDALDPALPVAAGADLVTCNPPYVPTTVAVQPEVADHDPSQAVFAGADGLAVIRPLVAVIAGLLRGGGTVVLEHDDSHQAAVIELFEASGCFREMAGHSDLAGRPRFVTGVRRDAGGSV